MNFSRAVRTDGADPTIDTDRVWSISAAPAASPSRKRRQAAAAVRAYRDEVDERLLERREQPLRFRVRLGGDDVDAEHGVRTRELLRRPEPAPIDLERAHHVRRRKVRGEGERQTERRRKLRAEQTRSENPDRNVQARARNRLTTWPGGAVKYDEQLEHILRKRVGVAREARRSARAVSGSAPGARPRARSMRPGNSDSSVPNCSAIRSGA